MSRLWTDNSTDRVWTDNSTDRLWNDSTFTTASPTTLATTVAPTTIVTTVAPTTLPPTTILPPTTSPPTTLVPTTLGPTTVGPSTAVPTVGPTTIAPEPKHGYALVRNGWCEDGFKRCKWSSLGRTMASQSSNAIDERGRMFTWGQNYYSQSGQGLGIPAGELSQIEYATQIGAESNWVKAESGELSTIAINKDGELWGWGNADNDCEPFGLPPFSGDNGDARFYYPRMVTPGYVWKDFTHDYYHTMAIDENDKLWIWGMNYDECFGMRGVPIPYNNGSATPIQHTYLTDDVKLIDCELLGNVVVTTNDKVYVFGEGFYTFFGFPDLKEPREITGLIIPLGETITEITSSNMGITALLSNGELWAAGQSYIFGDNRTAYPAGSDTFVKIPFFIGKEVVKVRNTSLGATSMFVIDANGNIWGWSYTTQFYPGNSLPIPASYNEFMLVASEYEGQYKWIDMINNEHQQCYQTIDKNGYLYTWGRQWWGPHLALGAAYDQSAADDDPNITDIVKARLYAGKAARALDYKQEFTTLNTIPVGESNYIQPLDQDKRHKPCGHWHKRLFEEEVEYPVNCWMPSLAVHNELIFFVASGKHQQLHIADTGSEVLFFTYNIDTGVWEWLLYEQNINASNFPGGAAIDIDIYAFFNYKADISGDRLNEIFTNPAMGIWVLHNDILKYTEWTDNIPMSGQNKLGVHSTGLVALAYTNTAGQVLIKVSTDFGVTFSNVKTLPTLSARKDYSLIVDPNGYIYLAHQISTTSIKIERSINNGVSWTTQIVSNYIMPNITKVKLISDNAMLFLICASETATAIERSENDGVSWTTSGAGEPGSSIVGSVCNISDGDDNYAIVLVDGDTIEYKTFPSGEQYTVYGTMYNYIWDFNYGDYTWLERDIAHLSVDSENMDISVQESNSTLEGYNGRFAYSSYGFFSAPDNHVAIVISSNKGANWQVISVPLGYNNENEISDFKGCPLFCIKDIPYLNHIWSFEKSDWNEKFVEQKDKYVKVNKCECK